MRLLLRFWRLRHADRSLVVNTFILMVAFRLGLSILPFRHIAKLAERSETRLVHVEARYADRVAWAVESVSRYVPRATCLVKAFTAKVLLETAGLRADIHIGVSKTHDKGFEAHAWVESQGMVVVGAMGLRNYTRLPSFNVR